MKYFIDTEFHEYHKQQKVCGIKVGKAITTIDLISIGIVSEDREYYTISKDFNIKDAWNSYQITGIAHKVYWLRENVLRPIFDELELKEIGSDKILKWYKFRTYNPPLKFTYKNFKRLINKYGKTNKQIAEEIKAFVYHPRWLESNDNTYNKKDINFYAYYADYDWVVFAKLFGKMIDLSKGFPMYCNDLKQELDNKIDNLVWFYGRDIWSNSNRSKDTIGKGETQIKDRLATFDEKLKTVKKLKEYPKQVDEHNALSDAKWNKELYKFLNTL